MSCSTKVIENGVSEQVGRKKFTVRGPGARDYPVLYPRTESPQLPSALKFPLNFLFALVGVSKQLSYL